MYAVVYVPFGVPSTVPAGTRLARHLRPDIMPSTVQGSRSVAGSAVIFRERHNAVENGMFPILSNEAPVLVIKKMHFTFAVLPCDLM